MIQELLDAFFQQPQTQNFGEATENIQKWISQMGNVVFLKLLKEIGVIPEKIPMTRQKKSCSPKPRISSYANASSVLDYTPMFFRNVQTVLMFQEVVRFTNIHS